MFIPMKRLVSLLTLCTALLFGGAGARADSVVETPQIRAEVLAEYATVAPGQSMWVVLAFTIKPHWHTYWRTPGDSGLPPEIRWTLPEGITAGPLQWPAPERIPYGDLMNFGYSDQVMMPMEFKVASTVAPGDLTLQADATWLVCADVCIPEEGSFTLPMTIGAANKESAAAPVITAARAQLPQPAPWPAKFTRKDKALTLSIDTGEEKITDAVFFPYEEGVIANAAPQKFRADGDAVTLRMTAGEAAPSAEIAGLVVLTKGTERVGYTLAAPIVAGPAEIGAAESAALPLILAVALAFVGGIILNVMPCVLPVLVMKALSFMSRGTVDAAALRRDGLAYTAGVLVTFGALVGLLLGLRAAGDAVGWGFQLQSPPFVAGLAYVMLVLGLNLSGVFNIGGNFGVGQELASRGGMTGSFFTGLLAVVVATPCTAPFMGTAIGFAMTQSPLEAVLIFEALGLGLAFPYLVLSFAPGVARRLPKPGVWMDRVKQVLAFPLYAAAAWLIWVIAQQLDSTGLAAALAGLVLVGFAAWMWGTAQKTFTGARTWIAAGAAIALLLTAALTAELKNHPVQVRTAGHTDGLSEPYSAARLAALRAEGRPVFVDFTAAWCITCKVNERVALSKPEVEAAFKRGNVAYLIGDWTNRNAEISAALRAVGRDGVPLYLFYPPGGAEPRILPQVLTPAIVIAAVSGADSK